MLAAPCPHDFDTKENTTVRYDTTEVKTVSVFKAYIIIIHMNSIAVAVYL
jgi:hypothetical protein